MSTALRLQVVSVLALLLVPGSRNFAPAYAQGDPRVEIRSSLAFAEENFDLGEPEAARDSLVGALARMTSAKLTDDPLAARVHMFLAILYLGPLEDPDKGRRHMQRAVAIDPKVVLDQERASEQAAAVYAELQADNRAEAEAVDCDALRGILHSPISESVAGQPIAMRAHVGPLLTSASLSVRYRQAGAAEWTEIAMTDADGCQRVAELPTGGESAMLEYWLVARTSAGKTAAQDGSETSPHRIAIGGGAQSASAEAESGRSDEDEVPPMTGARPQQPGKACAGCQGTGGGPGLLGSLAIGLLALGRRQKRMRT